MLYPAGEQEGVALPNGPCLPVILKCKEATEDVAHLLMGVGMDTTDGPFLKVDLHHHQLVIVYQYLSAHSQTQVLEYDIIFL